MVSIFVSQRAVQVRAWYEKGGILSECYQLAFNKGCAMCYHVYVIMHVKDP